MRHFNRNSLGALALAAGMILGGRGAAMADPGTPPTPFIPDNNNELFDSTVPGNTVSYAPGGAGNGIAIAAIYSITNNNTPENSVSINQALVTAANGTTGLSPAFYNQPTLVDRQIEKQKQIHSGAILTLAGLISNDPNVPSIQGQVALPGCKVKAKTNTLDPITVDYQTGILVFNCSAIALASANPPITPGQSALLQSILGTRFDGSGLKGRFTVNR